MLTWQFYAFSSAIFAALTAIFGKIGVSQINSNLATLIRTLIIFIFTFFLVSYRKEWSLPSPLSLKSLAFLVLSGLATGSSWLCYYHALKLGPASKVASIDKLSVVLIAIFAVIFLQEKLTWNVAMGALFISAGALLMTL